MIDLKRKHYDWVEALRAFLILYIASYHFSNRYLDFYPNVEFPYSIQYGKTGVFVFMMISGFFLAKTLLNGYGVKDYCKYCINRWWRLFPAALICITITYIVVCVSPLTSDRMVSFPQYLLNLLIIHPTVPYVDGAHWFIASLLEMQLLLGLLLLLKEDNCRVLFVILLFILSLGVWSVYDTPQTKVDNILYGILNCKWSPVFLSGIILSYVKDNKLPQWVMIIPMFVTVLYAYFYSSFPIIFGFLCFLLAISKKLTVECPTWVVKCGGVSFCWYLLHQNIGFCIMNELRYVGVHNEVVLVGCALLVTLFISFIVDRIIAFLPTKLFE